MSQAESSYEALCRGDYATFLAYKAFADSMPPTYREQLLVCYKQFLYQQKCVHGDILRMSATSAVPSELGQEMQVFLTCHYADGTNEEIVVPMVYCAGEWKMK